MKRILVFDLLRILAIIPIVFLHMSPFLFSDIQEIIRPYGIPFILTATLSEWGVLIFIVVSGAVLEYNYGNRIREGTFVYSDFVWSRLTRIYPVYWLSLVITAFISPSLLSLNIFKYWIPAITGTYPIFHPGFLGAISPVGWFVGLITMLYLIFPIASKFIQTNGASGISLLFIVSWFANIVSLDIANLSYVFPINRIFIFGLGIYIVQNKLYPETENRSGFIRLLSEITFPVFLFNYLLLPMLNIQYKDYFFNIFMYVSALVALSVSVYYIDTWFREMLSGGEKQCST